MIKEDKEALIAKFIPLVKTGQDAVDAATIAQNYHKAKLDVFITQSKRVEVDGYKVIEEFLLTKGENNVGADMKLPFKPLVDFGLIVYDIKVTTTSRLAMKFDLEKFFMRKSTSLIKGFETGYVKVPQEIYDRVKEVNDKYRKIED